MRGGEEVGLVGRDGGPRAGVVVGHEVEEVKGLRQRGEEREEGGVVLRTGGGRDGEEEVVAWRVGRGVGVEGRAEGLQEEEEVGSVRRGRGVFPVDVEAVEAEVGKEADGGRGEKRAGGWRAGGGGEGWGVGPAADAEEDFEVAVGFLEEEELLDAAVDVFADVVPR